MLDRLAKQLRAERIKKGSVKFESEELHFDIDEHGKPLRCYFKRSKDDQQTYRRVYVACQ